MLARAVFLDDPGQGSQCVIYRSSIGEHRGDVWFPLDEVLAGSESPSVRVRPSAAEIILWLDIVRRDPS